MLVNQAGESKGLLNRGDQKSLQTDRVILVPGPEEEVKVVRWIYDEFTERGKQESEIAATLNSKAIPTDLGRSWTRSTVNQILTNEKYIGNNVYNRNSFKLKKKHVKNTSDMWVRADRAFKAIIEPEQFYIARGIILERNRRMSDDEMLGRLRDLIAKHPSISSYLIDSTDGMPTSSAYRSRFGSLIEAYRMAGFTPDRNFQYIEINRRLRSIQPGLISDLIGRLGSVGATVSQDAATGLLLINNQYSASIFLSRCRQTHAGALRWLIRLDQQLSPDITILARMDTTNSRPVDYYLLPIMDIASPKLLLCEENGVGLDTYQFDSLDHFTKMAIRKKIEVAA